jgi:polar amino acid transport system substrate-binding protein
MNRSLLARLTAGLLLAGAASATASCASPSQAGTPATTTHAAQLDRSLHALLPESVRQRGVLRIGTDASYAPMSSFGPDGRTIVGLEPDLADDLGRVLGVRVRFVNTKFTDLIPQVAHGDLDLAMSAMTDTPARARIVDFVDYFSAGTAIVVQRGNPSGVTDIQDLCGRAVAVERGTTQVDLLRRAQKNCTADRIEVRTYATNSDAVVQLRTGRVVAVLNDLPPAAFLVNDPSTTSHYQLASTTQYEPGLYGIAVRRSYRGLRDAVQGACERLLRSGDYVQDLTKWGVRNGAVDRISIDADH